MAKTAICLWCGEEITEVDETWYHDFEYGPDLYALCRCHCADCDPLNGYTDGRGCIDGEKAIPDLLTIKETQQKPDVTYWPSPEECDSEFDALFETKKKPEADRG